MRTRAICVLGVLAIFAAAVSACNMPGTRGAVTEEPEPTLTPTLGESATLEPGETEEAAEPEETEATEEVAEGPCYDVSLVSETIEDGTEIVVGTAFDKTWRLVSDGCLPLPEGSQLVFDSGDSMGGPASVAVPSVAVGAEFDVTVHLTAPSTPGEYTGYWHIVGPSGDLVGQVWVEIVAVEPPPPSTAPDLVIRRATWLPDPPLAWEDMSLTVRVRNDGDATSVPSTLHVVLGALDRTLDVPALAPDERYDAATAFNAPPPGTYTLTLTVDAGGENDESDESNNGHTESITSYRVNVRNVGGSIIDLDECMDLDGGTILLGCGNTEVDFLWRSEGAAGSTYHTLVWQNGAEGGIYGVSEPDYLHCTTVSMAASDIAGGSTSNVTGDVSPGSLPVGTWVCYHTSSGFYGAFEVTNRAPFNITYVNWELSDS
jgi:hypothetical protein